MKQQLKLNWTIGLVAAGVFTVLYAMVDLYHGTVTNENVFNWFSAYFLVTLFIGNLSSLFMEDANPCQEKEAEKEPA